MGTPLVSTLNSNDRDVNVHEEVAHLREENRDLRDRVEHLESILVAIRGALKVIDLPLE